MNREALLSSVAVAILRGLFGTLTIRFRDPNRALKRLEGRPMVICFWHNRILGITAGFLCGYPDERRGVTVLTSPSRDGEILARLVGGFGMGAVRGSSSRRGARAQRELIRIVREGGDVAITPDGPRGPIYQLGPGVVHLAQSTGAPILPVHASFSRAIRMKTWDRFILPLPFSEVLVTLDEPRTIGADLDEHSFETERAQLENILKHEAD